jgi:hypothetical protein
MPCFLCGNVNASTHPIDHGNRTSVSCPSKDCGNYEISRLAASVLQSHPERRVGLQAAVQKATSVRLRYEVFFENREMVGRGIPQERA